MSYAGDARERGVRENFLPLTDNFINSSNRKGDNSPDQSGHIEGNRLFEEILCMHFFSEKKIHNYKP